MRPEVFAWHVTTGTLTRDEEGAKPIVTNSAVADAPAP